MYERRKKRKGKETMEKEEEEVEKGGRLEFGTSRHGKEKEIGSSVDEADAPCSSTASSTAIPGNLVDWMI